MCKMESQIHIFYSYTLRYDFILVVASVRSKYVVNHLPDIISANCNSHQYISDTLNTLLNQLTAEEKQHRYFMQDNAIAHTAYKCTAAPCDMIEKRIINKGL